jgi:hypothetical protein
MSDRERSDADLAELVVELRETLDELQGTVGADRPGPPSGRDLVRFTESYTIPTLVAILEASIQALELLQATLRLVDGRPLDPDRRRGSSEAAARVGSVGRATVDRVDAALSELTAALEGEPPEGEARDLLEEAQALRAEVDERLRTADAARRDERRERLGRPRSEPRTDRASAGRSSADASHDIPVSSEGESPRAPEADTTGTTDTTDTQDDDPVTIDVDAELESIREEVEDERERSASWSPNSGEGRAGGDDVGEDGEGEGTEE